MNIRRMLPACALAVTIVAGIILPDEKLLRLKLLVIECGLLITISLWLIDMTLSNHWEINVTKLTLAILPYVILQAIFYILSRNKHIAWPEMQRTWLNLAAFIAGANALFTANLRIKIIWTWVITASLIAAYGILQHTGGFRNIDVPKMDRIMGTFGNPIFFGAFLAMTIPLTLGLFLNGKIAHWKKIVLIAILHIQLLSLYYTGTRASWAGATLGTLIAGLFYFRTKTWRILFVIGSLYACIFLVRATKQVWLRDQGHILIWRDTVTMWLHNPVFGTGLGEFHIHFPAYAGADLKAKWPEGKTIINYSHNEYLQTLAETGIAGLAALAGFVFAFIYTVVKRIKFPGENDKGIAIGVLGAGTAVLLQNFFSVDMRFAVSSAFFFLIAGIASSFDGKILSFNLRTTKGTRFLLAGVLAGISLYTGQKLIKSYAVKRGHLLQPDFFQQKIVNAASTLNELETLALKFPKDPLLFEKLGYVCAKEIKTNPAMAEKALAAFQRATELDPSRWGAFNNIGNIYYTLGDKNKAIIYWERSLAIKPNQVDSRLNLAKTLYVSAKLKESAEQFKAVLELDPDNTEAQLYLRKMVE